MHALLALLASDGRISRAHAIALVAEAGARDVPVGQLLVFQGIVSAHELPDLLARASGRPVLRLGDVRALREASRRHFAALRPLEAVWLGEKNGRAQVGVADPCDIDCTDAIAFVLNVPIVLFVVPPEDLQALFDPPALPSPAPGLHACRFCGGTFGPDRFIVLFGACRGCTEAFLGVVYR